MPRPAAKPFVRHRRVLLAAITLLVGALAGLYYFGQSGRQRPPAPRGDEVDEAPEGEITLVGEGFEFTHTEGARRVFKIRGSSVRADRAGTVFLDEVALTLYDEEGEGYEVASREASFNRETREARLLGDVVLSGPGPTRITSRGVRLEQRGDRLVSTGPVAFRYGQFSGRADLLRIDRPRDLFALVGEVRVRSLPEVVPAASLAAQELIFERPRHLVRAEGDVVLRRGGDQLRANHVNAFLDEEDRNLIFVRARFEVVARAFVEEDDGRRPVTVRARSLSLLREPTGELRVGELEGTPAGPVRVDLPSPEGTVQRLVAGYVTAGFTAGRLASLKAFNGPRLEELAAGRRRDVLRELSGQRLEADLDAAGRVTTTRADEDVRYRDERLRAEADRARFDLTTGRGQLLGDPVRLTSDRGEVFAPRVTYDRTTGFVEGHEGVRALISRAGELGLGGTPFAAGQGPVRVEADEGLLREEPRGVLFRGDVRAWQGENLLLARELRGDQVGEVRRLTAGGGVRTVWIPRGGATGTPGGAPAAPVEISAQGLRYDDGADQLVYEGSVRAEQLERVLLCQRLVVDLTPEGEAERMTCTGAAQLDDRRLGNTARGEGAVYDLTSRTVTMWGEPVVLRKSDGAVVEGHRVVYSVDSGKARVVGEEKPAVVPAPAPPLPAAEPPSTAAGDDGR